MFTDLAITQTQALVFGALATPICLWVIYTDLTEMRIRNEAVLALLAVFLVAGAFLLPFETYLWRYASFAIALLAGFVLSATVGIGAGDAKFIAAVAPLVAISDASAVAVLYALWSLALLTGMTIARRSAALRTTAPDWIWFTPDRQSQVPFGLALAPTALTYFALGATAA